MNPAEDEEFTEFLRSKAREGKAAVGYPATLFHRMLDSEGGFNTVKKLLSSPRVSDGYAELVTLGRTDLTAEALVTETPWRRFFDPMLLELAEKRLTRTGYAFKRFEGSAEAVTPPSAPAPAESRLIERPLPLASSDAIAAAEWLKANYAAVMTWESRKEGKQQGDTPVRIYTLPNSAQVAIRMNKGAPAVYVRATNPLGVDVKDALSAITPIMEQYTGQENYEAPSSILAHAPYLKPAPNSVLLRLNPDPGQYKHVFELALGRAPVTPQPTNSYPHDTPTTRRPIDEEEFFRRQQRNTETGVAGELAALAWERSRLGGLVPPCTDPEKYALRISPENVGAGYDILSTWPGEERFIEVKSTVSAVPEFFMTENERRTLESLGQRAWIYRVELGTGAPVIRAFQDPALEFNDSMTPSAWRVKLC